MWHSGICINLKKSVKSISDIVAPRFHYLLVKLTINIRLLKWHLIPHKTIVPPHPNLRQQFQEALPKDRYRLVRISRQYLATEQDPNAPAKVSLEPPTPEKLFQQIWEKQGYHNDAEVLNDFMSLMREAEQCLADEHEA